MFLSQYIEQINTSCIPKLDDLLKCEIDTEENLLTVFISMIDVNGNYNNNHIKNLSNLLKAYDIHIKEYSKPFYMLEYVFSKLNNCMDITHILTNYVNCKDGLNYNGINSIFYPYYLRYYDKKEEIPDDFIYQFKNITEKSGIYFTLFRECKNSTFKKFNDLLDIDIMEIINDFIIEEYNEIEISFESLKRRLYQKNLKGNNKDKFLLIFSYLKKFCSNFPSDSELHEIIYKFKDCDTVTNIMNVIFESSLPIYFLSQFEVSYIFEFMSIDERVYWSNKIKNEIDTVILYFSWFTTSSLMCLELFEDMFTLNFEKFINGKRYLSYLRPSKEFVEIMMTKLDNDKIIYYLFCEQAPVIKFYSNYLTTEKLIELREKFGKIDYEFY